MILLDTLLGEDSHLAVVSVIDEREQVKHWLEPIHKSFQMDPMDFTGECY